LRIIEHLVEESHPCAYLAEERASMEVRVMVDVTAADMDAMVQRGWRRFGPMYFRPACEGCRECVSLRVLVDRFVPTKSQRRAEHASRALRRVVGSPTLDAARLALYAKWHANRERERGWASNPHTPERYALEFCFPHPCAREVAYYDDQQDGRLVGLGIFDETPSALSAAFFFYDPDYARYSLGTANVVAMVRDAQAAGLPYVYLGYCVAGCASLRYKAAFRPHELLSGRPAPDEQPIWRPGPSGRALA
jgi:arginyl-tRNA--protein-N-Asp/Glu arginylyltransferase